MFKFITHRPFWVNLLAAFLLLGVLVLGIFWMLGSITKHGVYEKIPSIVGQPSKEAVSILEAKGFIVEIQDSLWDEKIPALVVIRQSPEAEEMVKVNRKVYLTINRSQPPLVDIPNMVGLSFRNAELYLKQLGLKLGDTTRRPDIARDAVLEQQYNGEILKPGVRVFQGSAIGFVLGSGIGDDEFDVPDVRGVTFEIAKQQLMAQGLNTAGLIIDPDVKDTAKAFVYKQNPERITKMPEGFIQKNKIRAGQSIDLWLGTKMPEIAKDSASKSDY